MTLALRCHAALDAFALVDYTENRQASNCQGVYLYGEPRRAQGPSL